MSTLHLTEGFPEYEPDYPSACPRLIAEIDDMPRLWTCDDQLGGRLFEYPALRDTPEEVLSVLRQYGFEFVLIDPPASYGNPRYHTFLPDPDRFAAGCRANNTPARFILEADREGAIPTPLYESTVRSGKHPIGIDNRSHYAHDLSTHFPAIAIGGAPLIDWIVSNTHEEDNLAVVYDDLTFLIRNFLEACLGTSASDKPRIVTRQMSLMTNLLNGGDNRAGLGAEPVILKDPRDPERRRELCTILYEGLSRVGIHSPAILDFGR